MTMNREKQKTEGGLGDQRQASKGHFIWTPHKSRREFYKRGNIFAPENLTSRNRGKQCDLELEADAGQSPAILVVYRHLKRISTLFQREISQEALADNDGKEKQEDDLRVV